MRISVFGLRFICFFLICILLIPIAAAESLDLSSMTDDEIVDLYDKLTNEIVTRGMEKTATLPAGKYIAGKDIPVGSYIITCSTDESHHGIVWASSPTDDLSSEYPSVLYEHVSFSTEEKFKITMEEGGILCLPFTASLTISTGVLFR